MYKIGFIGLGIMGKPMCKNLLQAGYEVTILDYNKKTTEELVELGAKAKATNKEVADNSDVVITMLPNSPEVRDVCIGEKGIVESENDNLLILDMSSINPLESQKIGQVLLEKKGFRMLDAPVSGGEIGAIEGTLAIMVGGEESDYQKILEILKVLGKSVSYMGPLGMGNSTKLVNQIIVAGNIAILSEALVFAKKMNLDIDSVYTAISGGLAGSKVFDQKTKMMSSHEFNPGFKNKLHRKDLRNVLDVANELSVSTPLTSYNYNILKSLEAHGYQEEDHSSIVRYFELINKLEIDNR